MPKPLTRLTLVLGGARSGKSRHAEGLVSAEPGPWVYVATAQALDEEMRLRIAAHRGRRAAGWRTIEAPLAMPDALMASADAPVLVDCLTLWLTNLMLAGESVDAAMNELDDALDWRDSPTVLVANEVGLGIVPETPLGRAFRDQAGLLNQRMAARANSVVFTIAGIPMVVK